jgi:hypothetical protein
VREAMLEQSCRALGFLCDGDQPLISPRVRIYRSAREVGPEFRSVRVGEALPEFTRGEAGVRLPVDARPSCRC